MDEESFKSEYAKKLLERSIHAYEHTARCKYSKKDLRGILKSSMTWLKYLGTLGWTYECPRTNHQYVNKTFKAFTIRFNCLEELDLKLTTLGF